MKTDASRMRFLWFLLPVGLWIVAALGMFRGWGTMYFGHPYSDLYYAFYPWRVFMCRWFDRGVIPWWDPHVFGGTPVLEMQQRGLWNPIAMISMWLCSPRVSLLAEMAGYLAAGLAASLWGLRRGFGLSRAAATVGSCCFLFGGAMASRVTAGHFPVVAASSLMILATGCLFRAIRSQGPQCWRWTAVSAGACALLVYGGAQQYAVFTVLAQIAMAVCAFGGRSRSVWIKIAAVFTGTWLCAAMISAPQWMPTLAYLPWSARGDSLSCSAFVDMREWSVVALEFFLPLPLGDDVTTVHLARKNIWETAAYPGMVGFLLAVCSLSALLRRSPRASRWGQVAAGGVGVTLMGCYLCAGGYFPGMESFREPMKARTVAVLGLAILSALGTDVLRAALRHNTTVRRSVLSLLFAAATLLTAGYLAVLFIGRSDTLAPLAGDWLLGTLPPFEPKSLQAWIAAKNNPTIVAALTEPAAMRGLGFVILGVLLAAVAWRGDLRRRTLCACALFTLAAAEPLITHYAMFVSRCPYDKAELPQEIRTFFEPKIRESMAAEEPMWRTSIHNEFSNLTHHVDGLYELSGYDPIMPKGANNRQVIIGGSEWRLIDPVDIVRKVTSAIGQRYEASTWTPKADIPFETTVRQANPSACLVGIERNITAGRLSDEQYGPTTSGLNFAVPGNMARADLHQPLPQDFCETIDSIAAGHNAAPPRMVKPETSAVTTDSIRMIRPNKAPHLYEMQVALRQPAMVVLRTTWLPGWRARVDNGREFEPWIANNWMVAIPVTEGTHTVTFVYRPQRLAISWMIAALGLVLALAVADGALRNPLTRRRKKDEELNNVTAN